MPKANPKHKQEMEYINRELCYQLQEVGALVHAADNTYICRVGDSCTAMTRRSYAYGHFSSHVANDTWKGVSDEHKEKIKSALASASLAIASLESKAAAPAAAPPKRSRAEKKASKELRAATEPDSAVSSVVESVRRLFEHTARQQLDMVLHVFDMMKNGTMTAEESTRMLQQAIFAFQRKLTLPHATYKKLERLLKATQPAGCGIPGIDAALTMLELQLWDTMFVGGAAVPDTTMPGELPGELFGKACVVSVGEDENVPGYTKKKKSSSTELLQRELLQRELLQRELLQRELLQRELLQRELLQRELLQRELLQRELLSTRAASTTRAASSTRAASISESCFINESCFKRELHINESCSNESCSNESCFKRELLSTRAASNESCYQRELLINESCIMLQRELLQRAADVLFWRRCSARAWRVAGNTATRVSAAPRALARAKQKIGSKMKRTPI